MRAAGWNRNRAALALVCLAAGAAMLIAGREARDPSAHQPPRGHTSDDIRGGASSIARTSSGVGHATLWVDSTKPPGYGNQTSSRSKSGAVREDYALPDVESLDADASIAALSVALAHEDPRLRLKAVTALIIVGGDQAATALTTVALSDTDAAVRQEAVYALGEIRGEAGIEVFKHALSDPDVNVREAAVDAFVDIGGEQSALALAVALQDTDASLRVEVVEALGEIGGQAAIQLLRQASLDPQSPVREAAAELVAELSGTRNCDGSTC
jgi:hypothetical protein